MDEPTTHNAPQGAFRVFLGRRGFLGSLLVGFMGAVSAVLAPGTQAHGGIRLRPPGALPETDFLDACVRCFKCANACPNDCIKFHSLGEGLNQAFTPYIQARERGCILCGECAEACPSSALKPFIANPDGWLADVNMGTARVNKSICFSYNGRTCGACYQACPLAGTAIKIGVFETPIMQPEHCVGCGLCEQACLHVPQAIRVIPNEQDSQEQG